LGVLIGLLKKVRSGDGVLKLCSLREPIQEIFQVMRLDKIFEIFPEQQAALESF
jgi:anti-sigma B factor antagonist